MACYSTGEKTYGYDDSRFEKDVDENFHCSICYNVLKEPRMCRNNEHIFCLACITKHLRVNSQTCPECKDHLNVDTLRRARLASNYLSKLKINCDHASRGCPEFTCLEDLETHVVKCGYAPVLCSNAECGMVINKQDKVHHETTVCEYRRVKCHNCGQIQEEMRTLKGSLIELHEKVEAVQQEVEKEVKESLSQVNKDVNEVKVMMIQVLEKFNMLEQFNKLPSPAEGMLNTPREDILIAGGFESEKSTEIFSWEKNGWFEVSAMNEEHYGASSFMYNDQVFVVGGGDRITIETLDLNDLPLKWVKYNHGELPDDLSFHQTVVYQQRVIHIGGFNGSSSSDVISELQLTPTVTMEKLFQMPEPRDCHGAEIFEDKVLILGGEEEDFDSINVLNSVLEFDVKNNECKEMPPLPRPLTKIATVRWRDQVIVIGGCNKRNKVLDSVFMYDSKTGKTTALPSMLERRSFCCAVTYGNTIVVMGGKNDKGELLKSVECFTMGGYTWKYLPDMNKDRDGAIAEVLSCTRKYV